MPISNPSTADFTDYLKEKDKWYVVKTGGTIGTNCTHTTIAQALTDAQTAGNPKKIFIRNGNFTEDLAITTLGGISLIGESKENVNITAVTTTSVILMIYRSNCTIKNISFHDIASFNSNLFQVYSVSENINNTIIDNCYFDNSHNIYYFGGVLITTSYNYSLSNLYIKNCQFLSGTDLGNNCIKASTYAPLNGLNLNWYFENNEFMGSGKDLNPNQVFQLGGTSLSSIGLVQISAESASGRQGILDGVYFINNKMKITSLVGTYETALFIGSANDAGSPYGAGTSYIRNVQIIGNSIENNSGRTNNYGIYIIKNATNVNDFIDGITIVGNTIRTTALQHIVLTNTPTNIVDSGNNKI